MTGVETYAPQVLIAGLNLEMGMFAHSYSPSTKHSAVPVGVAMCNERNNASQEGQTWMVNVADAAALSRFDDVDLLGLVPVQATRQDIRIPTV